MTMRRIDLPEHRNALVAAVSRLSGCDVSLEMVAAAPTGVEKKPVVRQTGKERLQRMREIEANPMVKACVELFDAEIVKVDQPR